MNPGPLPARTVEAIYRELMSGSFLLERPLRIAYLGPAGSYSHQASTAHFGSSVEHVDVQDIAGVFGEVARGHADYGLVPIENTVGGGIVETLDAFRDCKPGDVTVYAEALLRVRHNLLAGSPAAKVSRVFSKPEVFTQCRGWLARNLPKSELIASPSSSRAVQLAREQLDADPECGAAAIASLLAGKLYGLHPLYESIEDNPNNVTRFLVLAAEALPAATTRPAPVFQTADNPALRACSSPSSERASTSPTSTGAPAGRTGRTSSTSRRRATSPTRHRRRPARRGATASSSACSAVTRATLLWRTTAAHRPKRPRAAWDRIADEPFSPAADARVGSRRRPSRTGR